MKLTLFWLCLIAEAYAFPKEEESPATTSKKYGSGGEHGLFVNTEDEKEDEGNIHRTEKPTSFHGKNIPFDIEHFSGNDTAPEKSTYTARDTRNRDVHRTYDDSGYYNTEGSGYTEILGNKSYADVKKLNDTFHFPFPEVETNNSIACPEYNQICWNSTKHTKESPRKLGHYEAKIQNETSVIRTSSTIPDKNGYVPNSSVDSLGYYKHVTREKSNNRSKAKLDLGPSLRHESSNNGKKKYPTKRYSTVRYVKFNSGHRQRIFIKDMRQPAIRLLDTRSSRPSESTSESDSGSSQILDGTSY